MCGRLIGRGLEQEFRDRLTALRSESEQENEVLLQQVEWERARLQEEVETLRTQETSLREEISAANQVRDVSAVSAPSLSQPGVSCAVDLGGFISV